MSFDTKTGTIYEPENPKLRSFYETLKKYAPTLDGSRIFDDFVEVYGALEYDMEGENK